MATSCWYMPSAWLASRICSCEVLRLGLVGGEIGLVLLGLALRGAELCGVFVAGACGRSSRCVSSSAIGVRRVIGAAGELGVEPVVGRAEIAQFGDQLVPVGLRECRVECRQHFARLDLLAHLDRDRADHRHLDRLDHDLAVAGDDLAVGADDDVDLQHRRARPPPRRSAPTISHSTSRRLGGTRSTVWKS